jgi:hypothetical protein
MTEELPEYHRSQDATLSRKLAMVISYALHPLIMPTLCMFILFQVHSYLSLILSPGSRIMLYGLVFFNTFLVPLLVSLALKKKGHIRSLHMNTREERKIPLLATAFTYTFTYYLLNKIPLSPVIYVSLMGAILALIIHIVVNLNWKISAHMTGFGGMLGTVFGLAFRLHQDLTLLICILFVVGGILGTARLLVTDHTPAQIYSGFLNGFLCQVILFAIL